MIKPYYEDAAAGITIYCGRFQDVLPQLGKFDLLLTDPPFGHGDKWQGGTWGAGEIYKDALDWDAELIPTPDILAMLKCATTQIVWGGNYYPLPPSRCWLSWNKPSIPTMADFELAWTSMDRPCKQFDENRAPDGKKLHACQKPLSLMSWCLSLLPEVKTVIDPMFGSGTTLRACKDRRIACVGVELSEKKCQIAVERLRQEILL